MRRADINGAAARTGRRTVPQIFIGDTHVGGFDDLNARETAGRLDPLVEAETVRRAELGVN